MTKVSLNTRQGPVSKLLAVAAGERRLGRAAGKRPERRRFIR